MNRASRMLIASRQQLVIAALLLALAGCAGAPPKKDAEATEGSYAGDPFVPVNVYLNPGEHIPQEHAALLNHFYERLSGSEAFVRTARGVPQWPYTLVLRHGYKNSITGWYLLAPIIAGASLGLIPVSIPVEHTLNVEVIVGGFSTRQFELKELGSRGFSWAQIDRPKLDLEETVDVLVVKLIERLSTANLLPRAREFIEPEAPTREEAI